MIFFCQKLINLIWKFPSSAELINELILQGAAGESPEKQQRAAERGDGIPQEVSQYLQGQDQPGC